MSEERYVFIQNGDFHTVKDTESGKPLIVEEFKENEFGRYCCFHRIIDLLNEQDERIKQLEFQLYCTAEGGVCEICKHMYLEETNDVIGHYYTAYCRKGHDECSKDTLKYCEDFDFKE